MKICIFQKRAFDFVGESTGERVQGFMYAGFVESGKAIEFSAKKELRTVPVATYEEEHAVNLPIRAKFFQGEVKYRLEDAPTPPQG